MLENMGNTKSNQIYEYRLPFFYLKSSELPESEVVRANYIKAKYKNKLFISDKYTKSEETVPQLEEERKIDELSHHSGSDN